MATEQRLIDANKIPWEEWYVPDPESEEQWDFKAELGVLKPAIDKMPTVDAVEVVRCEGCRFYRAAQSSLIGVVMCCTGQGDVLIQKEPNDFCSRGERKTDV